MKRMIIVKANRCQGCKTCELACGVEHSASKSLATAITESPPPRSRVQVERAHGFKVPLQCRQCENAPCVAVCPTAALHRKDQDSPVLIAQDLCIGCRLCVLACPFGVIRLDEKSKAIIKCDQCFARLERGELPACVEACPTGALVFAEEEEANREKRRKAAAALAEAQKE